MKKVIFSYLLLFSVISYSAFTLTVVSNPYVNFGSLEPGQNEFSSSYGYPMTSVKVDTDTGAISSLQVEASAFVGPEQMSASNMSFEVVYADEQMNIAPWYNNSNNQNEVWAHPLWLHSKTSFLDNGSIEILRTPTLATYGGTASFGFIWSIDIPKTQTAGTYYSQIMFTLTD